MKKILLSSILALFMSLLPTIAYALAPGCYNSDSVLSGQPVNGVCPPGTVYVNNAGVGSAPGTLGYTPLEPIPTVNGSGNASNIGEIVSGYFKIFILLGGFMAVGALVYGGIMYMISDVGHTLEEAKHRVQAALWGLLLLLASWLILDTINPGLVTFNLNFNPAPNSAQSNSGGSNTTNSSATKIDANECALSGGYIRFNPDNSSTCVQS